MATAERTAGRPLRADAERNRQRILVAAAKVFATCGLDASLNDVARCAGVGIGTLYRRFTDKGQLIDALFEQRIDALVELAEQAAALDDPWDGLVSFLEHAVEMQVENRGLSDLLFSPRHAPGRMDVVRARLQPLVSQLLNAAQQAGRVRRDVEVTDIPVLQLMLATVGTFSQEVSPQLWRRHLVLLLDGIRADGERSALPVGALTDDELQRTLESGARVLLPAALATDALPVGTPLPPVAGERCHPPR